MTEKVCAKKIDDELFELVDCKTREPIKGAGKRGKRTPSERNIFIGSCVKGKTGKITERFKACSDEWKRKKGSL